MKLKNLILTIITTTMIVAFMNLISGNQQIVLSNLNYYLIYSAFFTIVNSLYFKWIGKVLNWKKKPEKTLIISILGSIPVNGFTYLSLNYIFKGLRHGKSFSEFIQNESLLEYLIVIMFALIISLFIIISYFFKAIRESELKAEQLKTEQQRSKFNSLKNQVDPHFLFNNLNVLTALIEESPKKAEMFTQQLSDIYKYVLEQKEYDLVSLQKELDFAEKYLNLLRTRFEDGLTFEIPQKINKHFKIPPLSLQMVLENCIKHNSASSESPLHIKIAIEHEYLIVKNNKNIITKPDREGFGLKNIQKRFGLLTDKPIEIISNSKEFIIKLPLF